MSTTSTPFKVRPAYLEDVPFIFATWLRSYRHSSTFAKKISNEIYYSRHHLVIDLILKREGSKVLVAHPEEDPDIILGYVVTEVQADGAEVVHYTYVKKSFRRMGIAEGLWKELDKSKDYAFTHYTTDAEWLTKKYNLTYDPYRI
jgi:hypothetical protein